MKKDKHIIWSDLHLDYEDWRKDLEAEYPGMAESERIDLMHEINAGYLDDERTNLDVRLPTPILMYADLGLWNGRKTGYRLIESGNIRDCLSSPYDYNEWYVDNLGDFRCTAVHHDGTNRYLYRAIKAGATEGQVDRLLDRIYNGVVTRTDITRVTRRLGDDIAAVYGFSIPRQREPLGRRPAVGT